MSFFKKDNIKIFLVLSLILVAIVILFSISILNIQYKSYKSQMYNSLSAITSVLIAENKNIYIEVETNCLYLQIIIKDEGEGISKEDLPNIFKRFYKGKDSSKESFGIGLALAKTIIEKQNGEIRVQSKIGEGTQFRIRLFRLLYNMKVVNSE